jgi:RNA polymerase sigma-70 factor (ECF subfamily)
MEDKQIIEGFKNNDSEAIQFIYKAHYRPLCYFAKSLVQNKEEAQDIVCESFIKLMRKRNDFETSTDIRGFLYKVTRNACLDYIKHIRRATASHKEIIHLAHTDENFIESKIMKAELLGLIISEIENLPRIRRDIFKMIFLEGLSTSKIAEQLGITVDTVRVQKARAIHAIRTTLLKDKLLLLVFLCLIKKGL